MADYVGRGERLGSASFTFIVLVLTGLIVWRYLAYPSASR